EVSAAIARLLRATGARRVAASDSARVGPLVAEACTATGAELLIDAAPNELFDCDVGVSGAQWGIAETGTLVLESRHDRHRFVSLIPRVHIALLRADRVCDTLSEARRHTRESAAPGALPGAALALITAPSRTPELALTLAIGLHGPQEQHVIVMEPVDPPSEASATAKAVPPDPGRPT